MPTSRPWFKPYLKNISSQFGEDGLLEEILNRLPARDLNCVEFGAWDGKKFSNTHHLVESREYFAYWIEGNYKKYRELLANFATNSRVFAIQGFVGFNDTDGLDAILAKTACPPEFDILSVDIDGNDFHVWDAVKRYRPKVVIIEYNPTIPNGVLFIQDKNNALTQGASLDALTQLAKGKNYELIATTTTNAFFVDQKYFSIFAIADNSVAALRPEQPAVTHLFCEYDGTVFLAGAKVMPWHQIQYDEKTFQKLPRFLRKYPHDLNGFQRLIARLYGVKPICWRP